MKKKTDFISISPNDFKFTDFTSEALPAMPSDFSSDEWVKKLQELDAVIHREGVGEKITFADDRLVLVAFKALSLTGIFEKGAGLMHWWITHRYVTLFMPAAVTRNHQNLVDFIEYYIQTKFLMMKLGDGDAQRFIDIAGELYNEQFDEMPVFVIDAFEEIKSGKKRRTIKVKEKPEVVEEVDWISEEEETPAEEASERAEWEAIKATAEIMLQDEDLAGAEREEWQQILEGANVMLQML